MRQVVLVGMDISYGSCRDLEAFEQAVYAGNYQRMVESVSSRAPLRVARQALRDASLVASERLAVVVAGPVELAADFTLEMEAGWGSMGPVVSQRSTFGALAEVEELLNAGEVDAVLVVALDVAGTGAVVFSRAAVAGYATVAASELGKVDGAAASCRRAWAQAGITPGEVGYLETVNSPPPGLLAAYRSPGGELSCALSELGADFGNLAVLGALIKVALSVQHRTLPPLPAAERRSRAAGWRESRFYSAPAARPWFVRAGQKRVAVLSGLEQGQLYGQLLLAEPAQRRAESIVRPHLRAETSYLFPLAAGGEAALLARLEQLEQRLLAGVSLRRLANETFSAYQQRAAAPYALALVGRDRDGLLREIERASRGVPDAFAEERVWSSPQGSYFAARPLGGRVSLLFIRVLSTLMSGWDVIFSSIFRLFTHGWMRASPIRPGWWPKSCFIHVASSC